MNTSKSSFRRRLSTLDPLQIYALVIAGILFLLTASGDYMEYLYEHFLPIPCTMFMTIMLIRGVPASAKKKYLLSIPMVLWFVFLQIKRSHDNADGYSAALFLTGYLFAFPFASLIQDNDRNQGLKLFAGAITAASVNLVLHTALLVLDRIPESMAKEVYWDGARLHVFWHPNISSCIFLICTAFTLAFLLDSKKKRIKPALLFLLAAQFFANSLTNCRTTILLTCGLLGGSLFFAIVHRGLKWFLPALAAALAVILLGFSFAGTIYDANQNYLLAKYTAAYEAQQEATEREAAEKETTESGSFETSTETTGKDTDEKGKKDEKKEEPAEELPIKVNKETGKITLKTTSPQKSLEKDFRTLNGRTTIWKSALYALRESPKLLIWGVDDPGVYISYYNPFKVGHAHNSWMEILMGLGFPGLCMALLFTLIALWNSAFILLKHHQNVWKQCCALLVLCLLIAGFMEPYLFYTSPDYHLFDFTFFILLGYLCYWQEEDNRNLLRSIRNRLSR